MDNNVIDIRTGKPVESDDFPDETFDLAEALGFLMRGGGE